jgi:Tol biopolymer transport system component
MALDERLPGALRVAVGALPTELGDWDVVAGLARRRRKRRRRARQVVGALVLVVAVLVGVSFAIRSQDTRPAITASQSGSGSLVAVLGSRLVVLSASDGRAERTLVRAPRGRTLGGIAVSWKTRRIYYTVGQQCGPPPEIWQIPISGGTPRLVASVGVEPAISPDGHFLAYSSTYTPGSRCLVLDTLAVRDLRTNREQRSQLAPRAFVVVPVSWWPDSHRLEVAIGPSFETVRIEADGLRVLTSIQLFGNGWVFLPSGEAITAVPSTTTTRLVAFDPTTGAQQRTLTELNQPLVLLGSNHAGTSFLLGTLPTETSGSPNLYRADLNNAQPIKLAPNTGSAAWLPPTK